MEDKNFVVGQKTSKSRKFPPSNNFDYIYGILSAFIAKRYDNALREKDTVCHTL